MNPTKPAGFIRAHTALLSPPLVPELRLHLAAEVYPLWRMTEEELGAVGVPPPFWAFAWAGGQALARYVLDHPETVRGKRVLDVASGSGLVAIAAALSGAASVEATDLDPFAREAIALNAAANGVTVVASARDVLGAYAPLAAEVVLAGDVFYEQPMADRMAAWLAACAANGALCLAGDPGRSYLPRRGLIEVAAYDVATTRVLEDREIRHTRVFRVAPG